MMLNLKRLLMLIGAIVLVMIIDAALHSFTGTGIPASHIIFAVLLIALATSPVYDFYMLKKKQRVLYPDLKQRALEVAKKKKGILMRGELGKMPSEWHGWFIRRLEADGLAVNDPRNANQILFPEIIAESHTEDEIIEMELPMNIGAKILKLREDKSKKFEE
jgi:hypothetical protein